ncbi:tol-pal system-associated acyl-CoA thioesterase [Jannaschia sp. Os4]|uniref:tol-pal system-associated acyl-CoA thioesterase n=1 Tax=Jannaschia sp. Os4 TaxID=2807617 RepID=UPI00193A88EA|nr:tol-pal system-associated acyl-CoA thioesterase [Jannaschia sp. Os4]MBM2574729.1 tol-pal system-associated acyl-CoA thioesterase [Jannaschia sp. Os4]
MTHRWPIRVYYEDTDMAGIVYHANYLKFCERARSEMVREAGIDQAAMRADGVVFAVTRMVCDFRRTARYDDELVVSTEVTGMSPARFEMAQVVRRGAEAVFEAQVTVACLDARGRPVRLPPAVRALTGR